MKCLDMQFEDQLDWMVAFTEEMIVGRGEDNFLGMIQSNSALIGVFDGCGGLGARRYEQFGGHTSAYMASRIVCDAVRTWYCDTHNTDWNNTEEMTASLTRYITNAYTIGTSCAERDLKIRGTMIRDFPTTAAIALARLEQGGVHLHIWWAGDSRLYLMDSEGLVQLTNDDVASGDALSNLSNDSVLTNVLSSDGRYTLHYRSLTINHPTIVFAATDGCFDYIPSPMEFEYTVLDALVESSSAENFKQQLKKVFRATAGDDFSLSMMSFFHKTYDGLRNVCMDRLLQLKRQYIIPLQHDHSNEAICRLWNTYRKGYERYLQTGGIAMGEVLNGYELTAPFQNQNAGFSRWTFAVRKAKTYFLKEFIDPVYPDEESLSPKLRMQRIKDCTEFVEKKKKLYGAISRAADGNIVPVFEFFRCGSHYYVSSDKVNECKILMEEIAKIPLEDRVLLCCTAAHSVLKLHEEHIVHADIKASNVLIQKMETGKLGTKIIDFDCSFFEETPPRSAKELGVDQVYMAPEACQLVCGDPIDLTCKVDVFALGLLFHEYLTGKLPEFGKTEYNYAHEVVLDGKLLELSEKLPYQLKTVLEQMLACDPTERCGMQEVFDTLSEFLSDIDRLEAKTEETLDLCEPQHNPSKAQEYIFVAGDL